MSEETEVQQAETTEQPEVRERTPDPRPREERSEKPAGYNPVDVETASPDEIKERLDYLYKQVKPTQRELKEYKQIAADQSKLIQDLQSGMYAVVDHLQSDAAGKAEATLRQQMQQFLETGDLASYTDANEKLINMMIKKNQPKAQPQQKNETQKQAYAGAKQIAGGAFQADEISADDERYVEQYQLEKDESGRPLRPWTVNKSNDPNNPDPEFMEGLIEARAVFTNKRYANWTMEQKLTELDKRMGVVKSSGGQSVMGGNLTTRGKTSKITLSPKQQEIALRTKYAGPKKSDADHLEAYRKQIEKVKGAKR